MEGEPVTVRQRVDVTGSSEPLVMTVMTLLTRYVEKFFSMLNVLRVATLVLFYI
jgi:hypothetical protein